MYVLHSHWQPPAGPHERGQVLFWAETSAAAPPRARRGRGATGSVAQPGKARALPAHPFCAAAGEVSELLARLSAALAGTAGPGEEAGLPEPRTETAPAGSEGAAKPPASALSGRGSRPGVPPAALPEALLAGSAGETALWLPSGKSGPQPSPQLIHDWALDETGPALAAWTVPGLWLPAREACDLLAGLPLEGTPLADVALGADTRYWHIVTATVLDVLAGQKMAPVLVQAPAERGAATYQARWLAVLDSPQDVARLGRLAAGMPPVCRAEAMPGPAASHEAMGAAPRGLVDSFIKTMTDTLARRWAVAVFGRGNGTPGAAGLATRLGGVDGAAGRWLRALFGEDARVEASPAQLAGLNRSVLAWLRNLQVAGAGEFRVAFRLASPARPPLPETDAAASPPGDAQAAAEQRGDRHERGEFDAGGPAAETASVWQLHFLLQARRDPSLLVPAEEVWRGRGEALQQLGRRSEQPQERLLAALGYAGRLYPPLLRSLKSARPRGLVLDTDEAFQFLREAAPLFEQSGFGVLVPPWWNQRGSRLGLRLKTRPKGNAADQVAGRLSFEQLVEFQWELAVGETALTRTEFEALVALKSPLVQVRGQWVQLDPEQIEAAVRFYQSQRWAGETSLLGALQMGLAAGEATPGLPVEEVAYEGWLSEWMERLRDHDKVSPLPQPAGLHGQLRPYQVYGFSWLEFLRRYGLGACLADDMGLGKTIEAIALLARDKEQGEATGPVLLICPTSVVGNWQREVTRFAPQLAAWVHLGAGRLRGEEFGAAAAGHDLVLTSYPLARRDAEMLQMVPWRGVILDEAQNIKNPTAQQTQAIRRLPAGFRMALTGTPVENRLAELWSIMQFLNPGYLGSREHFRRDFAIPVERYGDENAGKRLRALTTPFILRRVKTDPRVIQDLPDKLEMKVYTNLSEEQASLYEAVVKEALGQVEQAEGIDRRGQVLAMLMKLKQVCDHPALFLHQAGAGAAAAQDLAGRSGKLDRLVEMLEEAIAAGDRALVFSQFAEMGHVLHDYLPQALGRPVLFLHGGTPAAQRDQMVARFQSEDGPPIFILSLKAGGVGLNLMHANHVFHFDRWWNPAVEDQATDRAFRIGQRRNVQVHKFISLGTLEEMIDDIIESKRALAQAIVGGGENWLTELSTEQLRDLVQLRREERG